MNHSVISLYYGFIIYFVVEMSRSLFDRVEQGGLNNQLKELEWLNRLVIGVPTFSLILSITTIVLCLAVILFNRKIYRLLASLFFVFFFFLYIAAQGYFVHSLHAFVVSSLIFWAFSPGVTNERRNFLILRLIQVLLLCPYFFSGLWKIRSLFRGGEVFKLYYQGTLEHLIYARLEGNGAPLQLFNIFLENPYLAVIGITFIILFQVSTIIPIVKLKYFKEWGVGVILFHVSTFFALGIDFRATILGVLFFMVYLEGRVSSGKVAF